MNTDLHTRAPGGAPNDRKPHPAPVSPPGPMAAEAHALRGLRARIA